MNSQRSALISNKFRQHLGNKTHFSLKRPIIINNLVRYLDPSNWEKATIIKQNK